MARSLQPFKVSKSMTGRFLFIESANGRKIAGISCNNPDGAWETLSQDEANFIANHVCELLNEQKEPCAGN